MGLSYDEIKAKGRIENNNFSVTVSIATNQENGIVSYANGYLSYIESESPNGRKYVVFENVESQPLEYYFSDRIDKIPLVNSGPFPVTKNQHFSSNSIDKIQLSIKENELGAIHGTIKLLSWNNSTFDISFQRMGKMLVGVGQAIGGEAENAIYIISFNGIVQVR